MPYSHRLQGSRFELKYVIDDALVRPLRDFALTYLEHDEHAKPENNWEYFVHSLYLDSRALMLCRATMHSHKNRFKLRIRFYDESPDSPVFFEIKRRNSEVILKQRAAVRREAVDRILGGDWPRRSDLFKTGDEDLGAVERFCSLRDTIHAIGQVYVSYIREAYVTPNDNSVRMTFDRRIYAIPWEGGLTLESTHPPLFPNIGGTVLELKFTNRFPSWMRQMVRVFDLERVSMAKYVACVRTLRRYPGMAAPHREIAV